MGEGDILKLLLPAMGPTGGVIVVVWLFVRFLTNHMSAQEKALTDVCATLSALAAKVDECHKRQK